MVQPITNRTARILVVLACAVVAQAAMSTAADEESSRFAIFAGGYALAWFLRRAWT